MYLSYDFGLFLIEKNYFPIHQFLFILFILLQSINLGRKYIPHIQLCFIFILFIILLLFILRQ